MSKYTFGLHIRQTQTHKVLSLLQKCLAAVFLKTYPLSPHTPYVPDFRYLCIILTACQPHGRFIDTAGKVVIECLYEQEGCFNEGYAAVIQKCLAAVFLKTYPLSPILHMCQISDTSSKDKTLWV